MAGLTHCPVPPARPVLIDSKGKSGSIAAVKCNDPVAKEAEVTICI